MTAELVRDDGDGVEEAVVDDVLVLRMSAGRANALSTELCAALVGAVESAPGRASALVLTGSGGHFSSGGDFAVVRGWSDWTTAERAEYVRRGPQALVVALTRCGVPTVAAVDGSAYGAGMDVALACDVRVAAASARFCEAYVNVALCPGDGGSWLLPRLIGMGRAMDLLLSGRAIDAREAEAMGVVSAVFDDEVLVDEAVRRAHQLGRRDRSASVATRSAVLASSGQTLGEHLEGAAWAAAELAGAEAHRLAVSGTR